MNIQPKVMFCPTCDRIVHPDNLEGTRKCSSCRTGETDPSMIYVVSYKHPKYKNILYRRFCNERIVQKEIIHGGKTYLLYEEFGYMTYNHYRETILGV